MRSITYGWALWRVATKTRDWLAVAYFAESIGSCHILGLLWRRIPILLVVLWWVRHDGGSRLNSRCGSM
ncbi:hypothetical protein BJY01DRAFT_211247 [Aspergillus pseudoustus]|uniref:Secreted protein n=1 Tax=Aspergillus pseudoustus TaxID=1810923 RepID=A0ABR4K9F1_9EURO